jgi:hypothetical protein
VIQQGRQRIPCSKIQRTRTIGRRREEAIGDEAGKLTKGQIQGNAWGTIYKPKLSTCTVDCVSGFRHLAIRLARRCHLIGHAGSLGAGTAKLRLSRGLPGAPALRRHPVGSSSGRAVFADLPTRADHELACFLFALSIVLEYPSSDG